MPKYYEFKVCGYYLYFTSHCVIECMHVHASDSRLTEAGSAKFFVRSNGDTEVQQRGVLNDREISRIQEFIKENYLDMYVKWSAKSDNGFFGENYSNVTTVRNLVPYCNLAVIFKYKKSDTCRLS